MSEQYNWQQKVLSLIWLTYCLSIPKTYFGPQEYLQKFATKAVKDCLADAQIRQLIGTWNLVWGCAIYQLTTKVSSSNVNDHTMFVAKYTGNPDIDQYVIALAGTNPFSLQNILFEDINVATADPWNQGQPWAMPERLMADNGQPAVSVGISKALKDLMTSMRDGDTLLLDYLKSLTENATKPIEITVAGHSLAGAMSPALALSLVDRQTEWDRNNNATIKVVSLAGFSPGNEAFANYYNATLGDNTERLWNQIDVVPNVWEVQGLQKIPAIYTPNLAPSMAISIIFKGLELASQAQNYTHIKRSTEGFPSSFNPSFVIGNLADDPDLKGVVLDMCAELIAYPVIQEIEVIPFLADSIKDKLQHMVEEFSEEVREVLDDLVTRGDNIEDALKERLNGVINQLSGLDINLFFLPLPDKLHQILSTKNIVNLVNYVLQLLYHHVWRYSEYYEFTEFDQRRQAITAQVADRLEQEETKVQTENTVIVNYGSAKQDDIDDLLHGEGKLLNGISGIMERLKQSGQVNKTAQPVIFLVQKKKDSNKF